jgi:hypothetical protein
MAQRAVAPWKKEKEEEEEEAEEKKKTFNWNIYHCAEIDAT